MLKSLCKTLFTLQGCRIHTTSQVLRKKPSKAKGKPKAAKGAKGKDSKSKDVKKSDQPVLTIPEPKSHTLRKHDNIRRCKLYEFGLYVGACLPKYIQKVQLTHGDELELLVAPEGLYQVNSFLKLHQHASFTQCSLVTAIDVPQRTYRFEVIYNLLSFRYASRVRVKTYTDEVTPLPSAYSIWSGVNWYEREVYDMYGVVFANHPDLRRILTDYGFPSHPLRKDFPLIGYTECRYDDELKKIVYEPVEFAQEGRRYQLNSPWNYFQNFNTKYNNPPPPPGPPRPPPPPPPPKKK